MPPRTTQDEDNFSSVRGVRGVKVIWCDNYARETVAEKLVQDDISEEQAKVYLEYLIAHRGPDDWYRVEPDDYRLWRGMEDLA